MKQRKVFLISGITSLIAMFALVNNAQAARRAPLADPEPMQFGCKLSMEQAENAIKSGLRERQWTYKKKQPGLIEGKIVVRGKHTLWIDIAYTQHSFDINYKNSDNLNYRVDDDGMRYLHPNGNSWMHNVVTSTMNNVYAICP